GGGGFTASHNITIQFNGTPVSTTPNPCQSNNGGNIGAACSFNVPSASPGSYSVSATDGTHTLTATFAVIKATPTITFGAAPTPTYLGGNFTVSATTTNTDSSTLTYSVSSGPCALVSGSTFSSSGAGTC